MIAITNGTLYTPRERIPNATLLIDGAKIHALGANYKLQITNHKLRTTGYETKIDACGLAILPGLLDLHTFGCLGAQLTTPERAADELGAIARNVTRFGVTGFLISPPMGDTDFIARMLTALADAIPRPRGGARCLGIHLEGPYLDPEQRGAFPREVLRAPDVDEMRCWLDAARGFIRIVTLAPNLPHARAVATFLRARGVVASLGHSNTDYETARAALTPRGEFSLVTHIFNAMTGLHHRAPGVVGAALESDATAMLIDDGLHVHPTVVKMLLRAKTTERVILVSDAIAGAGLQDSEFELFGQRVFVRAGRATLANGTLAGSVLTLNRAVVNARQFGEIAFGDAVAMATLNPARVLGLASRGELRAGADADVTVLNEETGEVLLTMVGGEVVSF